MGQTWKGLQSLLLTFLWLELLHITPNVKEAGRCSLAVPQEQAKLFDDQRAVFYT